MKTSQAGFDYTGSLLGNEKALNLFEGIIEKKANEIVEVLTSKQ
jgi:hypothetical protein